MRKLLILTMLLCAGCGSDRSLAYYELKNRGVVLLDDSHGYWILSLKGEKPDVVFFPIPQKSPILVAEGGER